MHHIYFVLICLVWGSNFILMHRAGLAFGAAAIGFWRLAGGAAVLAVWWWASRHGHIARRHWPHLVLVALLGNAIPFVLQPVLIALGFGHSYFGITISFVPLLTVIFSIPMLGILPTWRQLIGVLGGLVALAALMWDGADRGMSILILALAFGVPLMYAASNTYIRRNLAEVPAIPLTTAIYVLGALMVAPLMIWPNAVGDWGLAAPAQPTDWPLAVASVAWLSIIGTGISGAVFVHLLHKRGPLYAGMVSYLIPIVALGWGVFDKEHVTLRQTLAVLVVLSMVALVQSDRGYVALRRSRKEPAATAVRG